MKLFLKLFSLMLFAGVMWMNVEQVPSDIVANDISVMQISTQSMAVSAEEEETFDGGWFFTEPTSWHCSNYKIRVACINYNVNYHCFERYC